MNYYLKTAGKPREAQLIA